VGDGRVSLAELSTPPADEPTRPWRSQPWSVFRNQTPDEHRWLIDGLLPAGALAFVAGPPKKGKTWLGLAAGLALATGRPLFGEYQVAESRDVLYIALEGSNIGLRARIGALARGLGIDPESDELERLHMLYRPRPFDLVEVATADWLLEEAADVDAALVVVDVLRAAARFKENDAAHFALVRDALEPLLAVGRTVALLHHFGKLTETQKERSPGERMAGTGAMYGALDVGLLLTRSESGARRIRVDVEARDFAAPEALGIAILGNGSGEHGGFTYADTATLALDETAIEGRDYVGELEQLFADGKWRTLTELSSKQKGIGANRDEIETTLVGSPERFVTVSGALAGRHVTARPWGTMAMYEALDEEVAQVVEQPSATRATSLWGDAEEVAPAFEQPGQAPLWGQGELQVEQVAPPKGGAAEQPAPPHSQRVARSKRTPRATSAENDYHDGAERIGR
jgi:AAA domain-containing protein